jgi:hypothetical protein
MSCQDEGLSSLRLLELGVSGHEFNCKLRLTAVFAIPALWRLFMSFDVFQTINIKITILDMTVVWYVNTYVSDKPSASIFRDASN